METEKMSIVREKKEGPYLWCISEDGLIDALPNYRYKTEEKALKWLYCGTVMNNLESKGKFFSFRNERRVRAIS